MAGDFDAYAVTSPSGPHVTLQAGLVHLGRHWTTATRQSAKVRAVRRHGWASVTTRTADGWRLLSGPAVTLDLAHPSTLIRDPYASGLAGGALIRLGLGRLDQLVGYAEAGAAVPAAFLPPGRVLLATRIHDEMVIGAEGLVTVRGRWAGDPAALRPRRGPLRSWWTPTLLDGIPNAVANLALRAAGGWLGVHDGHSSVALPALWDPATGRVSVSRSALLAVGAHLPGAICVTLDDSGRRRPDEKVGVMLRGEGTLVDLDAATASVAVAVARLSYWHGFSSGTKHQGPDQVGGDTGTAGPPEWQGAQPDAARALDQRGHASADAGRGPRLLKTLQAAGQRLVSAPDLPGLTGKLVIPVAL